jgi:hypothetical protein
VPEMDWKVVYLVNNNTAATAADLCQVILEVMSSGKVKPMLVVAMSSPRSTSTPTSSVNLTASQFSR